MLNEIDTTHNRLCSNLSKGSLGAFLSLGRATNHVGLARLHVGAGLVEGHQATRTRSVNGLASTSKIVEPADAVGQDGRTGPRCSVLLQHFHICISQCQVVVVRCTDKHRSARASHFIQRQASCECLEH